MLTKPYSAHALGLIDDTTLPLANELAHNSSTLALDGKYREAKSARDVLHALIQDVSKINLYDVSTWDWDRETDSLASEWLALKSTKRLLGVNRGVEFESGKASVKLALEEDFMKSYAPMVRTYRNAASMT